MASSRSAPRRHSGPGGPRPGAGAKPGNQNALKVLPWDEGTDLETWEGFRRYLKTVIRAIHTRQIEVRSAGALNNILRLYADINGWMPKAPLQIIQAQTVVPADISRLLEVTNPDEQIVIAKAIKRLEESENSPRNR